jgi:hypothetical protein
MQDAYSCTSARWGEYRALGPRGRARGVEELDEVVVADAVLRVLGRGVVERPGQDVVAQRAAVQLAKAVLDRLDVHGQRGVDERGRGLGLREQVGELVAAGVEVDRHVDEAGAGAAQVEQQVGVGVLAERGHAVAVREPEAEQRSSHTVGAAVKLGVGPAPVGEGQRQPAREPPGRALEHGADGAGVNGAGPWASNAERAYAQFGVDSRPGANHPSEPTVAPLARRGA